MKKISSLIRYALAGPGYFLLVFLLVTTGCRKQGDQLATDPVGAEPSGIKPTNHQTRGFVQVNLVANNAEYDALRIDPVLINAWGLAFGSTGAAWISAQAGHVSTIYNKDNGSQLLPPVTIPTHKKSTGGNPTGIVFNATNDFKLPNGEPARFIFAGLDGVISGWNGGSAAVKIVDNVVKPAVYTGLAIGSHEGVSYLYAANFAARKIDVFNRHFHLVSLPFSDPDLPASYSPFNVQNISNQIYVMYAKLGPDGDEVKGPGKGYVDIYTVKGKLIRRLVSRGYLNAPWGVAVAPAGFLDGAMTKGDEDDDDKKKKDDDDADDDRKKSVVLVGNFGDGRINAYSSKGKFLGQLSDHKKPIEIEGLWALSFLPPTATVNAPEDRSRLYFTAGPDDETHGLFGYLKK